MLFIAAALLTASMHSIGVVGSPGVPAVQATAIVRTATPDRGLDDPVPVGAAGSQPVMTGGQRSAATAAGLDAGPTVADLAGARGRAYLDDLAAMSPTRLRAASRDARVVATAEDHPPASDAVRSWWAALTSTQRTRLERNAPVVVGNLDGVPYAVRDAVNRTTLRDALAAGDDDGTSGGSDDRATLAMLGQVKASLVVEPGEPAKQLLTLDTRGAGRAAIGIGDVATAAHVTVLVPGMFFTVTGQMTDFTDTAEDLYDEQATLSPLAVAPTSSTDDGADLTAPAGPAGLAERADVTGTGVAVVAWMGYRTPDLSNVLSLDLARTGSERLVRTLDALHDLRAADEPTVSVVAHSYGSTTALMALATGHVHVDSLTLLGSPGSDVRSASQLAVTAGQVFVGGAHWDPVAGSGYFGTDPASASFGSTVLDLAGGADAAGDVFRQPVGHNDYLKPGTASLHDVALVAIGRSDLVRGAVGSGGPGRGGLRGSPDFLLVRPQDLQLRD